MLRHLLMPVAALTIVGAPVAHAAEITASITHIDVKARIIVIDHRAFHVPNSIEIGAFKIGQQVTVVYEINDGQLRIVSIRVD